MIASLKLYFKIFLASCLFFAFIMLFNVLIFRTDTTLSSELIQAVSISVLFSICLGSFHIYSVKNLGTGLLTDKRLSTHQQKHIKSKLDKPSFLQAIKRDSYFSINTTKTADNNLQLSTPFSWKSFGEEINIVIKKEEEGTFIYQVSSKPKIRTTMVDYGKNLQNITQLETILSGSIHST